MTDINWQTVEGVIQKGHQVASGRSSESPYPYGTIEKQIPYFKVLGLDLTNFFRGTLNVSIRPKTWKIRNPQWTFPKLEWTELHPPETFSFSTCGVVFGEIFYDSWIYYPHPETKKRHFQDPSIIEIIAPPIAGIQAGKKVKIHYNPLEIIIYSK